ncbi:MAG: ROK family protein [Anaerolineae bacterium]|nr:ROK family protein [Anaerolineae bacterium]
MTYTLALDFGGTKLATGLVDGATGRVINRCQQPTPPGDAHASLSAMFGLAHNILAASSSANVNGIGISFGGPLSMDRRSVARSMHVPGWEGLALPDMVAQTFGLPCVMDNDANLAAFGEWRYGSGRGTQHMIYIQVSTGIGAGLVLDGRLYRGTGYAGEFGHLTIDPEGPMCACGKRGCVESLAAGWAIARDGQAAFSHSDVDARRVCQAARDGDPQALAIVQRAFTALGIGIANAINLISPELIVIGGGVARSGDVMLPIVEQALAAHVLPVMTGPRLALAMLGDDATLAGCAALVEAEL